MRPSRAVAPALAALALLLVTVEAYPQVEPWDGSVPRILPYQKGDPIPNGYHLQTHARRGLVVWGAILFGIAYLSSIDAGATAQSSTPPAREYQALYAPLVGPYILAAQLQSPWLALADGLAQGGAVWMCVAAFVWPKQDLKRDEGRAVVQLIPVVGRSTQGLAVVGQF